MPQGLPDPKVIFRQADAYHFASSLSADAWAADARRAANGQSVQIMGPTGFLLFPIITLQAFACELYLKALFIAQLECMPKVGHDLIKLFNKLPEQTRALIKEVDETVYLTFPEEQLLANARGGRQTFNERLDACRHTFVRARYVYEQDEKRPVSWSGSTIVVALNHVCLTMYPHWNPDT